MKSLPPNPHPYGQLEALIDRIEQDLLALTTASLDPRNGPPRQPVDEFANEFLGHFVIPPRPRPERTPRGGLFGR